MTSVVELRELLILLSFITIATNIGALIYAFRTARKQEIVLQKRPVARAFFIGLCGVVSLSILELVYLTVLFMARAPYSLSVPYAVAPYWIKIMANLQYFVYYGEALAPAIVLAVISWGIRCLPEHRGIFKNAPLDPAHPDTREEEVEGGR